jgi:hypothetical protein
VEELIDAEREYGVGEECGDDGPGAAREAARRGPRLGRRYGELGSHLGVRGHVVNRSVI